MLAMIIGLALIAFTVFAALPGFIGWGAEIISFLKGAAPVLSAFIGMDNSFFMQPVPYIRVLGMTERGKELLRERVSGSPVPVITRTADINRLDNSARKVFETECRATDLFGLSLKKPLECGLEYTSKIITER